MRPGSATVSTSGQEQNVPKHPGFDAAIDKLGGSVYSALAPRIATLKGELYPLHIGDTWKDPGPGMSWKDTPDNGVDRPHRYSNPAGINELLDDLIIKVRERNQLDIEGPGNITVTAGATGALYVAARATVCAGDEVMILAPYWPLVGGIAVTVGATAVEVPILHRSFDADELNRVLEQTVTDKTAAIYLNTPSNPVGVVFDEAKLAVVAEFAKRHSLWIWSDEVYEDYVFEGAHLSIGRMAPERTLTAFSFSKAYGMAGYRCGYLVGPKDAISRARKALTYVWYSTPTPSQLIAREAIKNSADWVVAARKSYQEMGYWSADRLGLARPHGSTFLFLDATKYLDDRGLTGFLLDCIEDNIILAPGSSFGPSFGNWVRICYTSVPPEVVKRGIEKLAKRLGR